MIQHPAGLPGAENGKPAALVESSRRVAYNVPVVPVASAG
jgi:hypothetical protein